MAKDDPHEIEPGLKAVIELTAERAATKAIDKHSVTCSIGRLWEGHERHDRALGRLTVAVIVVGVISIVGGGIVGAVRILTALAQS